MCVETEEAGSGGKQASQPAGKHGLQAGMHACQRQQHNQDTCTAAQQHMLHSSTGLPAARRTCCCDSWPDCMLACSSFWTICKQVVRSRLVVRSLQLVLKVGPAAAVGGRGVLLTTSAHTQRAGNPHRHPAASQ